MLDSLRSWAWRKMLWAVTRLPVQLESNRWVRFQGTWEDALSMCRGKGYAEEAITEAVLGAARRAERIPGAWDRDGAVFLQESFDWPLLAALQTCRANAPGNLRVLDFGGGSGRLWRQHRRALGLTGSDTLWTVVEQDGIVQGCRDLQGHSLRFTERIPEDPIDVVIAACALNYVADPVGVLERLGLTDADWLILDRIPLVATSEDQLMLQNVNPRIYKATYPCWFFSDERFRQILSNVWEECLAWESPSRLTPDVRWMGGLFRRRTSFGAVAK